MLEYNFANTGSSQLILPLAVAFGMLLTFFGLYAAFSTEDAASAQRRKLMKAPDTVPVGLLRAWFPKTRSSAARYVSSWKKPGSVACNRSEISISFASCW